MRFSHHHFWQSVSWQPPPLAPLGAAPLPHAARASGRFCDWAILRSNGATHSRSAGSGIRGSVHHILAAADPKGSPRCVGDLPCQRHPLDLKKTTSVNRISASTGCFLTDSGSLPFHHPQHVEGVFHTKAQFLVYFILNMLFLWQRGTDIDAFFCLKELHLMCR